MASSLDEVCAAVQRSRRYRWIAPDLVQRLARDELKHARDASEAAKQTKRRLHQIFGAYVWEINPEKALVQLAAATAAGTPALQEICRALMGRHASTRERLPILDRFYRAIFELTGPPESVLDVACGLGPLALSWMDLPAGVQYVACEVDRRLVRLVEGFLTLCNVDHLVELRDVGEDPPTEPADVALVLKTLPCLEQQTPGSAGRLLQTLRAHHLVVSFPTRSLGGHAKGMAEHYRAQFLGLVEQKEWRIKELLFPGELVFVLRRE